MSPGVLSSAYWFHFWKVRAYEVYPSYVRKTEAEVPTGYHKWLHFYEQSHEDGMMIPALWLLWMRKLSLQEAEEFAWGHRASTWQSRDSSPGPSGLPRKDLAVSGWKYLPDAQRNKLEAQAELNSSAVPFELVALFPPRPITPFSYFPFPFLLINNSVCWSNSSFSIWLNQKDWEFFVTLIHFRKYTVMKRSQSQ